MFLASWDSHKHSSDHSIQSRVLFKFYMYTLFYFITLLIFGQGTMYTRMIFINSSSWYRIGSMPSKLGKNLWITPLGKKSCKQLLEIMTERKNLLPYSDLRAERSCIPTHAHAESPHIIFINSGADIISAECHMSNCNEPKDVLKFTFSQQ